MSFIVVIPARYAARRLPGKPLALIGDKPMIQWVFERAQSSSAQRIYIATDDARIASVAQAFGALTCLTDPSHRSGTERLAQVAELQGWSSDQIVVNLQGDEPFITPEYIDLVAQGLMDDPDAMISTLYTPITDKREINDPNTVKVVGDLNQHALYFSRAPIPYSTGNHLPIYHKHIGIYAYRVSYLRAHMEMPASPLEIIESLEQLRALSAGYKIRLVGVKEVHAYPSVDTPEDLEMARAIYRQHFKSGQ